MNDNNFENYRIAKTWKRICARTLDIVLISLIPLLVTLIWTLTNKATMTTWWAVLLLIVINFGLMGFYFVVLPWIFNGRTVGKLLLGIKLVSANGHHLSLLSIIIRELFLVFIPVILSMAAIFVTNIFFGTNIAQMKESDANFWVNVFIRTTFSFVFAWYLGIMIVTKVDKKHQLFYDRKYQLYVVNNKPMALKKPQTNQKDSEFIHVHLGTNQPGKITDDELKNIQEL